MVVLRKMNSNQYEDYLSLEKKEYAKDLEKLMGISKEKAIDISEGDFENALKEGINTKDSYLYNIVDEESDDIVGSLLIMIRDKEYFKEGFIGSIRIFEKHKGKGFGKAGMIEAEKKCKELGASKMGLHVFGHNKKAFSLYEKLGYESTDIIMAKEIE